MTDKPKIKQIQCPECDTLNAPDATTCRICGSSLLERQIHHSWYSTLKQQLPIEKISLSIKTPIIETNPVTIGSMAVVMLFTFMYVGVSLNTNRSIGDVSVEMPKGNFRIASPSEYSLILEALSRYERGFNALSSSTLITSDLDLLMKRETTLALSDRHYGETHRQIASLRGFGLEQVPVGYDLLILVSNLPDGYYNIALSAQEIDDIFSGRLTNWNQIGGPNVQIVPILTSGLERNTPFLHLEQFNPATLYERTPQEMVEKAKQTIGSITYISASRWKEIARSSLSPLTLRVSKTLLSPIAEDGNVNIDMFAKGIYPLTRSIVAIYRVESSAGGETLSRETRAARTIAQALESKKGQKLLKELGFLPMYEN